MALKTPQQYLESLKDGRVVYCDGREGSRTSRSTRSCKITNDWVAMDYVMSNDPQVPGPAHGHRRGWREGQLRAAAAADQRGPPAPARSGEAVGPRLLRQAHGRQVRRQGRPERGHRREPQGGQEVRHPLCGERRGISQATSRRTTSPLPWASPTSRATGASVPSQQMQHKDFYVRIVEERADGIVVSGAKTHISQAPACNEILIAPCRAMQEDDKAYAVAFGMPAECTGHHHDLRGA